MIRTPAIGLVWPRLLNTREEASPRQTKLCPNQERDPTGEKISLEQVREVFRMYEVGQYQGIGGRSSSSSSSNR